MNQHFPPQKFQVTLRLLAAVPLLVFSLAPARAATQPFTLRAGPVAGGTIPLAWSMESGGAYRLQESTGLDGDWTDVVLPDLPVIATTAGPANVSLPLGGPRHFYRLRGNTPFDPAWASAAPLRTITLGPSATFTQLSATIQSLVPGDRLLLQAGTYTLTGKLGIRLAGTAVAPIRIEAAPGAAVRMHRPDALQNILDIGDSAPTRFLAIRGIEFSGGATGLRLGDCENVWIDSCHIHDTDGSAITANTAPTRQLHITRNEISHTGQTAEGIYLGSASGPSVSTASIVALNHIHDTPVPTGGSGAGIFIRQGSSENLVAANHIHDTGGPALFLAGTGGLAINTVESNRCYRAGDDSILILADCLVRNNLAMAGPAGLNGFRSAPVSGVNPTRLTVVNNTFLSSTADAVRLTGWATGTSMVFANNACYSQSGMAVNSTTAPTGTTFSGNIRLGAVSSGVTGFQAGTGLADFTGVNWAATGIDARPAPGSPLLGAATATFAPPTDLNFLLRTAPHATGCYRP